MTTEGDCISPVALCTDPHQRVGNDFPTTVTTNDACDESQWRVSALLHRLEIAGAWSLTWPSVSTARYRPTELDRFCISTLEALTKLFQKLACNGTSPGPATNHFIAKLDQTYTRAYRCCLDFCRATVSKESKNLQEQQFE